MNRGDAFPLTLSISVNGSPIQEGYADDIELTFNPETSMNCVQKTLKNETIVWSGSQNKYVTFLSQEDTFRFFVGNNKWQLRLLKDGVVVSTALGAFDIGVVNSIEVLK